MKNVKLSRSSRLPVVVDLTSQQCIWSAAGAAPFRFCHNAFDCTSCAFDRKMRRESDQANAWAAAQPPTASWEGRKCRHMLSGYVPVKYCHHNFHCADCEYDQLIESEVRCLEPSEPDVRRVAGFTLGQGYYFHSGHLWLRVEYGGQVRVGFDDFAARLLGPADGYRLPGLGADVERGRPMATLERSGREAPLLSPVRGMVVAVNPALSSGGSFTGEAAYGPGWLAIIEPAQLTGDLKNLLFGKEADVWLENEVHRLERILYPEAEYRMAATGANALDDIYGSVAGLDWDQLVREFLQN